MHILPNANTEKSTYRNTIGPDYLQRIPNIAEYALSFKVYARQSLDGATIIPELARESHYMIHDFPIIP